jgi:hypothetical protein
MTASSARSLAAPPPRGARACSRPTAATSPAGRRAPPGSGLGSASRTSRSATASSIGLRSLRCRFSRAARSTGARRPGRRRTPARRSPRSAAGRAPGRPGRAAGRRPGGSARRLRRDLDGRQQAELGDRRLQLGELADVVADVVVDIDELEQDVVERRDRSRQPSSTILDRPLVTFALVSGCVIGPRALAVRLTVGRVGPTLVRRSRLRRDQDTILGVRAVGHVVRPVVGAPVCWRYARDGRRGHRVSSLVGIGCVVGRVRRLPPPRGPHRCR